VEEPAEAVTGAEVSGGVAGGGGDMAGDAAVPAGELHLGPVGGVERGGGQGLDGGFQGGPGAYPGVELGAGHAVQVHRGHDVEQTGEVGEQHPRLSVDGHGSSPWVTASSGGHERQP
jgi:hypothetical protein